MLRKIAVLAAVVLACCAFRVVEFRPTPVGPFVLDEGGRCAAVEVFAPTNGSVSLKRVWTSGVYTNAIVVVTNATGSLTVGVWSNVTTHVVYTNWSNTLLGTNYRNPYAMSTDTNLSTSVTALADVSTNVVSGLWKVVSTTNTVVSGSATSTVYSGAPSATNYFASGEMLLFDGTAGGGFLRLILE